MRKLMSTKTLCCILLGYGSSCINASTTLQARPLRFRSEQPWINSTLPSSTRNPLDQNTMILSGSTAINSFNPMGGLTLSNTASSAFESSILSPSGSFVPNSSVASSLLTTSEATLSSNVPPTDSTSSATPLSSTAIPGSSLTQSDATSDTTLSSSKTTQSAIVPPWSSGNSGPSPSSDPVISSSVTNNQPDPSSIARSSFVLSTAPISTASTTATILLPPLTTGAYSGLTPFLNLPGFTTSATSTIPGVVTHTATKTRGEDDKETPIIILFPCLLFCGGGGGGGSGGLDFGILFNIGPAPGIYYPPDLPPLVIGLDGIPTPNPPDAPPKPTSEPENTDRPSDQPSPTTSFSYTLSSSSGCSTQTASACSTHCVGDNCSTSCSAVVTGCSATCTGTTCSQKATVTLAPWYTGWFKPYDWVAMSEYDSAKADSVASAIDSLVEAWEIEAGFTTATSSSTVIPSSTTFTTLVQPSSESPPSSSPSPSPSSEPPPPPPKPTKALSIVLFNEEKSLDGVPPSNINYWTFYTTSVGEQAELCQEPVLTSKGYEWPSDIKTPPFPNEEHTMKLYDEEGCKYSSVSSSDPGTLRCPSMSQDVVCKEDGEKAITSAIQQCLYSYDWTKHYHRVAYCEW